MEEAKKTGTTTVGLRYKDGIVLVSDQKSTMGYLVSSKSIQKVYKLTDSIGITIAGSVGDVQSLIRLLRAEFKIRELDRGKPISVKAAATLTSNILQGNKYMPYLGQFIIGGYDETGPQLFSLDPFGGLEDYDDYTSTGSGSVFAYGVLEDSYKKDVDMDSAVRVAIRAVRSAKERDIASGGKSYCVSIIDKSGYRELNEKDIEKYVK